MLYISIIIILRYLLLLYWVFRSFFS